MAYFFGLMRNNKPNYLSSPPFYVRFLIFNASDSYIVAEISYEEAFYVYQKVSSAEITQSSFLQAVLNLEDAENSPDYSKIIGMVEKVGIFIRKCFL